jgi:hemolysin activation/secretion protein
MPTFHHPHCPKARRLGALIGLAGAMLAPAWAQTPPDAGRLLEETRQPPRPALPSATAPRVVDVPVRPTITLPEGVTVQAGSFRVTGASSYPAELLTGLLQPWVGKRLDINGLNEAAGVLTRHYQSNGHLLTYAYIPAQRVADGVVEIAVLEGKLEGVQIVTAQDVRLRDELVQAHTDRLATDASNPGPVLQAEVERQMLLLNDLPGVTARAAFTPGSTTGGAEMVVSVAEDDPLALQLDLDNHGSRSTGEFRAGIGLQLRDLFGWGDHTQARALLSNKGGLVSGSLRSSVAAGGDGYRVGFSVSRLSYQLGGSYSALGAVGNANTLGVDMRYPFVRSADTNLNVRVGAESKRLRDDIQLIGSTNPKRNKVLDVTVSADHRDTWGGVSAASVVASMGSLSILDDARRAADVAGLNTGRRYSKLGLQFARQQALGGPYSLYVRAGGQFSGGNLDSSEKFALAGPYAVRSYAPGEASVDRGGLLTLEARYAADYLGGSFVWALFHDHAEGRINARPLVAAGNEPKLSGTGLSVQWNGADVGVSASVAWRGSRLPTAEGGDPKPRLYLQVVVTP